MKIIWELNTPMPGGVFQETKLAADAVDAAEPVSVQPTQSTPQVYADEEPTLPVASSSGECAYVAEPVNAQPEAPILRRSPRRNRLLR